MQVQIGSRWQRTPASHCVVRAASPSVALRQGQSGHFCLATTRTCSIGRPSKAQRLSLTEPSDLVEGKWQFGAQGVNGVELPSTRLDLLATMALDMTKSVAVPVTTGGAIHGWCGRSGTLPIPSRPERRSGENMELRSQAAEEFVAYWFPSSCSLWA